MLCALQTVSTLSSFILFMVKYPEVQKRAQEEVDRVIGSDRLASFSDRESLPYIDAVVAEVLRLRPPVSVGRSSISNKKLSELTKRSPVTREAGQDDIHNGYLVEKGTVILVNFWSVFLDRSRQPVLHANRI